MRDLHTKLCGNRMIHPGMGILLWIWMGVHCCIEVRCQDAGGIILSPRQMNDLGIELIEAKKMVFEDRLFVLGRAETAETRKAVVSSRVAGRIVELMAHPGDKVAPDQVVAVIETLQPGNPPPRIELRAFIGGVVMGSHVSLGEPVDPMQHLMEVSDISVIHAVARIPENAIEHIATGLVTTISFPARPGHEFMGTLFRIGSEVNPENATLDAHFAIENPDALILPGMRAELFITIRRTGDVLAIPNSCIQGSQLSPFVFVQDYSLSNRFIRSAVSLGVKNNTHTEISSGIFPGDLIVSRGAYILSFAGDTGISLKEALDQAHGHQHNDDGSEISADGKDAPPTSGAANQGMSQTSGSGWRHPWTRFLIISNGISLILIVAQQISRSRKSAA